MKKEQYFFVITICGAFLAALLLIFPFLKFLVFALLLTYLLNPAKKALLKKIRSRGLCAAILVVLILIVIILPTIYVSTQLVREVRSTISFISTSPQRYGYLEKAESIIQNFIGEETDLHEYKQQLAAQVRSFVLRIAPNLVDSLTDFLLGLFIMFFVLFYAFQIREDSFERVRALIPLAPTLKDKLVTEVQNMTWAVVYGQVVTAIVQGGLGGVGFLVFGLPSPVLWGFVMIILSFLPLVGTPIIWVPAGIYLLVSGETIRGIGLLIWGGVLVMNVDNVLKPRLISGRARIHPVVVLLGVLGGLKLFGFIGMVVGPLLLGLMIALIRFYEEEYLGIRPASS
ncbi:MAG: AI-2E family transporter [Acidobacteriota bacterium]